MPANIEADVTSDLRQGVVRVVETVLPTRHATFRMLGYADEAGVDHVALVLGIGDTDDDVDNHEVDADQAPLVRVHSECLTGDTFGSRRCDCGEQLEAAQARIAEVGRGAIIYVRGHEGRGIGLLEKLRAYRLQDDGLDTVDANLALGHPDDLREYAQSAAILADLGLHRIRLMSSNPAKEEALRALGVDVVERSPLTLPDRPENAFYLATKRDRMRHDRPAWDSWSELLEGRVPAATGEQDVELYGPLVAAGPRLVIAQLGQSLDGFIASRSGDARFVTGPEDRARLHRMRALVDAVVVGAGTVVADDPRLTVRDVAGPNPVRVLLDPHARIQADAQVLQQSQAPTLWIVGDSASVPTELADHVSVLRLPGDGCAEPATVLDLLAERGLRRVLIEGGGRVVSSFVAAGVIDRLYLTTSALLIGDGVPGLRFDGRDQLADAVRGPSRRFRLGDDLCTEIVLNATD